MPVARRAFHWQPVRSTKEIASIAARSGTRGLWQPKGCFGRGGTSGSILAHSSSGSRQPSSRAPRFTTNAHAITLRDSRPAGRRQRRPITASKAPIA